MLLERETIDTRMGEMEGLQGLGSSSRLEPVAPNRKGVIIQEDSAPRRR